MPLLIVMALLTCTTVGLIPHYTIIVHSSAIRLTDPPTSLHTCTRGCLEMNRFLGSLDFLFNRAEVASPVIRPRGTASHNFPCRSTFFRFRRTLCCDGFSGSLSLNPTPKRCQLAAGTNIREPSRSRIAFLSPPTSTSQLAGTFPETSRPGARMFGLYFSFAHFSLPPWTGSSAIRSNSGIIGCGSQPKQRQNSDMC